MRVNSDETGQTGNLTCRNIGALAFAANEPHIQRMRALLQHLDHDDVAMIGGVDRHYVAGLHGTRRAGEGVTWKVSRAGNVMVVVHGATGGQASDTHPWRDWRNVCGMGHDAGTGHRGRIARRRFRCRPCRRGRERLREAYMAPAQKAAPCCCCCGCCCRRVWAAPVVGRLWRCCCCCLPGTTRYGLLAWWAAANRPTAAQSASAQSVGHDIDIWRDGPVAGGDRRATRAPALRAPTLFSHWRDA